MKHRAFLVAAAASVGLAVPIAAAPSDPATQAAWANRLTWGATSIPAAKHDAPGSGGWLTRQLEDSSDAMPPEAAAQIAAMRISTVPMAQLVVDQDAARRAADAIADPAQKQAARDAYNKAAGELANEARTRFVLRALYGSDQLREQMTWFWFNHFNVHAAKRDINPMIGDYEETIRTHAFGKFRDLLEATLRHPAMLRYLDNDQNAVGRINENYAREIMELHSMGVGSGYSQQDVQELARILTGVGVNLKHDPPRLKPAWQPLYVRAGLFEFNPARHDFGDKQFLGHTIKGAGYAEVEQALDLIAAAPATAHHVSTQIATYFMGDAPPQAVVARMERTFEQSHGDIAKVMRTMIRTPEFAASLDKAFKDPVHYVFSALRLAYGDHVVQNPRPILGWLGRFGEALYGHETPDGYDMTSAAWSGPGQMSTRFDIARQIGAGPAVLFQPPDAPAAPPAPPPIQASAYVQGMKPMLAPSTQAALAQANSPQEWNALFLFSPEFMRR